MPKIRLIWFLICLIPITLSAQSTKVRGTVVDAETGEPIPFVSVFFDGTTIGISTDLEGNYVLETRSKDARILTAHIIGYLPSSFQVANGSFSVVNFSLKKDEAQLDAALVRPDDRYIRSILDKIDRNRIRHDPDRADAWKSDLYTKIELDVTHAEDLIENSFLDRHIGFILDYRDTSAVTGASYIPVLISENVSRKYHSKTPPVDKEVIKASRISGIEQDNILRQFTGSYLLKTNFYQSQISVLNLDIPSPASNVGHTFYNYFLVDSLQVDGRKTYTIRFHPKRLVTSPVLDGEMNIDAEDFAIRSVHANLAAKSNVNWIRHINVDIENERIPDGHWFTREERLFVDFSVALKDSSRLISLMGNRQIVYSNPVFEPVTEAEAFSGGDRVVIAPNAEKDELFWEESRPYELTQREKGIFTMVDQLKDKSAYKWVYGTANMMITGFAESKKWGIGYGPWARTVTFNDTEGVRVQAGFRTTKEFSRKVRLRSAVAYGFGDREFKGNASAEFIFNREKTRKLTLYASKDYEQLGRGSGVFTENNIFNSLLARGGYDKQSMMREASLTYDHEFSPSFNTLWKAQMIRIYGNASVPLIRKDGTVDEFFSAYQLHWTGRFSWEERINRGHFDKSYLFTRFPIITVDLLAGIPGIMKNDYEFYRGELTVDWKVPAGAIGFGTLHLNGGAILGSVPYPLLKLHEGNQTYFLDKSGFSCMNYYEFASDRWITAFYEHNFNGFFFGKIPLLNRLDLREVVTGRVAWGTISNQNTVQAPYLLLEGMGSLEKPYVEVGAGISNIFRMFRIDGFWRLTHRKEKNFTINIGLDLEF